MRRRRLKLAAYSGVFRGALDIRAAAITEEMKLAAANAIAGVVRKEDLSPEYVVPSVFNREVVPSVAAAVAAAAANSGVARRARDPEAALAGTTA